MTKKPIVERTTEQVRRMRAKAKRQDPTKPLPTEPTLAQTLTKAIQEREQGQPPHLIVVALAGTGKTTTLVEGLKVMWGEQSALTPSPQQAAVWAAMAESRDATTVAFVAFNRSIRDELKRRVPPGVDTMTMHGMGLKAVSKAFGREVGVYEHRAADILAELCGADDRFALRASRPVFYKAVLELVDLCKMNLTSCDSQEVAELIGSQEGDPENLVPQCQKLAWNTALSELAAHYDVDINGQADSVFDMVPRVLERCKTIDMASERPTDRCIDYADMIWLPVVLRLPVFKYHVLLVDEAQDLNRCQQALAQMAGHRLILCGDPNQAIYGFAGADSQSIPRMQEVLGKTPRGVKVLPLTVTRRCGKAIVEEARKFVPNFEAHESNPPGQVHTAHAKDFHTLVAYEDMILSRVNAPLVSLCYRFLKRNRKANIQGRKIGEGLISLIERFKAETLEQLIGKLTDWLNREVNKEMAKKAKSSEQRIAALQDKNDCIMAFVENEESVQGVVDRINSVFTDAPQGSGIRLSSVHKAKGLEAGRVFLYVAKDAPMPHPMAKSAWEREQERNLQYVAVTRAINELVYVRD